MKVQFMLLMVLPTIAIGSCRSRDARMAKLSESVSSSIVAPGRVGDAVVIGDTSLQDNRNIEGGMPSLAYGSENAESDVLLSRRQFVIAFDSKAKVPAWTSWQVVSSDVGSADRSDEFRSDEILNNYLELNRRDLGVTPADYAGSCFDKGHQSPSADRTRSGSDNNATFYMSNMAPQTSFLNRRIWKDLESHSRNLVKNEGRKLQIYAGVILRDGRERIGRNKDIQVPDAFYKVVAVFENDRAKAPMGYIAVIMPNVTSDGLDPLAERDTACNEQRHGGTGKLATKWESYRVALSELETKAKVKFPQLASLTAY